MSDPDPATTTTARPWIVQLTCCGRDNGTYEAATWQEADQFRESYTSGPGAYAGAQRHGGGHFRSAVITGGPAVADPDAAAATAAPCGAHPITEDCCCLCHEAGRKDERQRIIVWLRKNSDDLEKRRWPIVYAADLLDGA